MLKFRFSKILNLEFKNFNILYHIVKSFKDHILTLSERAVSRKYQKQMNVNYHQLKVKAKISISFKNVVGSWEKKWTRFSFFFFPPEIKHVWRYWYKIMMGKKVNKCVLIELSKVTFSMKKTAKNIHIVIYEWNLLYTLFWKNESHFYKDNYKIKLCMA